MCTVERRIISKLYDLLFNKTIKCNCNCRGLELCHMPLLVPFLDPLYCTIELFTIIKPIMLPCTPSEILCFAEDTSFIVADDYYTYLYLPMWNETFFYC